MRYSLRVKVVLLILCLGLIWVILQLPLPLLISPSWPNALYLFSFHFLLLNSLFDFASGVYCIEGDSSVYYILYRGWWWCSRPLPFSLRCFNPNGSLCWCMILYTISVYRVCYNFWRVPRNLQLPLFFDGHTPSFPLTNFPLLLSLYVYILFFVEYFTYILGDTQTTCPWTDSAKSYLWCLLLLSSVWNK